MKSPARTEGTSVRRKGVLDEKRSKEDGGEVEGLRATRNMMRQIFTLKRDIMERTEERNEDRSGIHTSEAGEATITYRRVERSLDPPCKEAGSTFDGTEQVPDAGLGKGWISKASRIASSPRWCPMGAFSSPCMWVMCRASWGGKAANQVVSMSPERVARVQDAC